MSDFEYQVLFLIFGTPLLVLWLYIKGEDDS